MRTANPLAPTVIAPAPRDAQRDLASSRVPMTQTVDVVAPPVSAPQRDVSSTTQAVAARPRRRRATAVAGQPRSQQLGKLRHWRRARQSRASATLRVRRRVTRKIWRWRPYAPGCAASGQHRRPGFSGKRRRTRPVSPQVRSWAPPTSYHLRRASAAAKPSLAADAATREPVPAVRSTWVPP